eukprot:820987-Rhodomonas_salina.1
MKHTQSQMAGLKNDMQSQIAGLQSQIVGFKNDMQSQIAGLQSQIADLKNDTQSQIAGLKNDTHCILMMGVKAINRQALAPGDPIVFPPTEGAALQSEELPRTLSEFWSISAQQAHSLCEHYGLFPVPRNGEQRRTVLARFLGLRMGDLRLD